MKVIVIGLGSMGKRRIRLIKKYDEKIEILGVDAKEERCEDVEKIYGIKTFSDLKIAVEDGADCAFICTSPLSHADLISFCLKNNLHVFTEINLVAEKYDENIKLAACKNLALFLSSTFLYRDEMAYIQDEVKKAQSALTYSYHVGQYLPDWHPWENYTDYFIGDKRTNGCREIMAIEFPWIYKTFGEIVDVYVRKNKKTKLKTDYNDSYLISVEHENGIQGSILIDVVSRKAVRNLEIFGEDLYLSWDGTAYGLRKYDLENKKEEQVFLYDNVDKQKGYAEFVVENAYFNEIKTFFRKISGKETGKYSFDEDKRILALIDKIEG